MASEFQLTANVDLGVVPTHLKFVGGLVPDEDGRLPRNGSGDLRVVESMAFIVEQSPVIPTCVQVPYFPGLNESDVAELVSELRDLGLSVHFILMIGGGDPMNPEDEDTVVEILVGGLKAAKNNRIEHVSSTSVEQWMHPGATRRDGEAFSAAVAQTVKVHSRAVAQADLEGSSVKAWHIEFLRGGEFQTFTDIGRIWQFVNAANKAVGKPFFKVMVDAAHCGDSTLDISENVRIIREIADADALGIFHASAKTTRGCLSTDDGWIGALLAACAETGKLQTAFVEVFHHEDPALEGLRTIDPRHGVDTTDGRTYDQVVIDGLVDVGRRLNNLKVRNVL